jgi:FtsH-binding integral membrane protein
MSYNYQDQMPLPASLGGAVQQTFESVMQRVYLWMALGLLLTAGVAAVVVNSPLIDTIANNAILFYALILGELGLVVGISFGINKLSPEMATGLFFAYAGLNGLTLAFIFLIYTSASIALTFVATASLFGAMSLIGYTTKMDLSQYGSYLLMALLGLIIASVVNMFWANSALDWIVTYVGILIFLGLTVYDTQRIKRMTITAVAQGDSTAISRIGILGALSLYLDFINLFLRLLRVTGRRR